MCPLQCELDHDNEVCCVHLNTPTTAVVSGTLHNLFCVDKTRFCFFVLLCSVASLLLNCCYSVVILLLFCCYSVVILLLFCCYSVVILLLFCCYSVVILLLFCCYSVCVVALLCRGGR